MQPWFKASAMFMAVMFLTGGTCRDIGHRTSLSLAAMLSQVSQKCRHVVKIGAVNQVAPPWLAAGQARMHQFFEVEGERAGGDVQLFGHHTGRQAIGSSYHQSPESAQTLGLRQGCQGFNGK